MKILMISRDPKVFDPKSEVAKRMISYGELVDHLDIVVFPSQNLAPIQLSPKVKVYPSSFFSVLSIAFHVLNETKAELVTVPDPFITGLIGVYLRRRFGVRLEVQVHTDFLSPYWRGFKNSFYRFLALWVLRRADCVRVVSGRIGRSLELKTKNLKLKTEILPIYTPLPKSVEENIRQKYSQFDFIILMVSRLTKEKNISMAIDAMADITKSFPKTLLLILGDGPERKNLELKTYNLKLKTNVVFEGWKDNLGDYYKAADLYLLTSDYEGWGRTVIEAASLGTPVVMTNVGLAGKVIEHEKSGLIFEPRDAAGLVKILQRIFRKDINVRTFAKEAQRRVQPFLDERSYLGRLKISWERC